MNLSSGLWETFHDPTVNFAVALLNSRLNKRDNNVIRHHLALVNALRYHHRKGRHPLNFIAEQWASLDAYKTEPLRNDLWLSSSSRAWRPKYNHSGWASWGIILVSNSKHSGKIIGNLVLILIYGIILIDEAIEGCLYSVDVKLKLLDGLLCHFIKLRSIKRRICGQ